jgi:hypothetical protein
MTRSELKMRKWYTCDSWNGCYARIQELPTGPEYASIHTTSWYDGKSWLKTRVAFILSYHEDYIEIPKYVLARFLPRDHPDVAFEKGDFVISPSRLVYQVKRVAGVGTPMEVQNIARPLSPNIPVSSHGMSRLAHTEHPDIVKRQPWDNSPIGYNAMVNVGVQAGYSLGSYADNVAIGTHRLESTDHISKELPPPIHQKSRLQKIFDAWHFVFKKEPEQSNMKIPKLSTPKKEIVVENTDNIKV